MPLPKILFFVFVLFTYQIPSTHAQEVVGVGNNAEQESRPNNIRNFVRKNIPFPKRLRIASAALGSAAGYIAGKTWVRQGEESTLADSHDPEFAERWLKSGLFLRGLLETPRVADDEGPQGRALLVALHGCSQNIASFRGASELSLKALPQNIHMLYPQQSYIYNMNACWNWFLPANQSKEFGESRYLMKMIEQAMVAQSIPAERVYIVGFSAGAAQAANLLACYPNFFRKSFLYAGTSYGVATPLSAARVLSGGVDAITYRASYCDPSAHHQPIFVLHGAEDQRVHPSHASLIAEDFLNSSVEILLFLGQAHQWSGGDGRFKYTFPEGPGATDFILGEIRKDL